MAVIRFLKILELKNGKMIFQVLVGGLFKNDHISPILNQEVFMFWEINCLWEYLHIPKNHKNPFLKLSPLALSAPFLQISAVKDRNKVAGMDQIPTKF